MFIRFLLILCLMFAPINSFAAQWLAGTDEGTPLGTSSVSDLDTNVSTKIADPLTRLLSNYRHNMLITYNSASQLTVGIGEVMVSDSGGTIRLMMNNTSSTTVSFSDLDTGAEASSTTYYVYAIAASASAETATFKVSTSSTSPSGVTYYRKLGSFYNNSSSDIEFANVYNDDYPIYVTGTIAGGSTISLPTGYTQNDCRWTIGTPEWDALSFNTDDNFIREMDTAVSSSRVVTARVYHDWDGGNKSNYVTINVQYLIACQK